MKAMGRSNYVLFALAVFVTLTTPACSRGSAGVLPSGTSRLPATAAVNADGSVTVGGTIVAVKGANEFEVQAGPGCGYLNVYTTSSTTFSPSGATPAVGQYALSTGSGSCATAFTASSVKISAPATVRGEIVAIKSPSEFQIQAGKGCGYLSVFTSGSTAFSPSGSAPSVGKYAVVTGNGSCATSITASAVTFRPSHIEVVIMENRSYGDIIGNSAAPYLNALATSNVLFTNSHGVTHPSEPNYLALFAGSTEGLTTDACPVSYTGATLAQELAGAGRVFKLFAEQLPADDSLACSASADSAVGSGYLYWRKHNPAADFPYTSSTETQPWAGASTDLSADVSFIIPNICDDMHDCSIATGDAWASAHIPAIESYNASHNGLLIVTFDEAEYDSANHIVTIFDGLGAKGQRTQYVDHYAVLRYIEDSFNLPYIGNAATAYTIQL